MTICSVSTWITCVIHWYASDYTPQLNLIRSMAEGRYIGMTASWSSHWSDLNVLSLAAAFRPPRTNISVWGSLIFFWGWRWRPGGSKSWRVSFVFLAHLNRTACESLGVFFWCGSYFCISSETTVTMVFCNVQTLNTDVHQKNVHI